ncbi:hypothetical protein [Streptomyces cinereoruber]|uniref:hypothetical protein n=1 Tax=Streptomyces cinereoruber TaxID=67260 RepID=UPI003637E3B8
MDGLKTHKEAVDAQIRRLPAYGREFHSSHPYSLEELARHSGHTFSGVRTAYGDKEIQAVAEQIGRQPNRRAPQRRQDAMSAAKEGAPGKVRASVQETSSSRSGRVAPPLQGR